MLKKTFSAEQTVTRRSALDPKAANDQSRTNQRD
jgi:hypothetical protein